MAKQRGSNQVTDLVTFQPGDKITVLPPNSGVVGAFPGANSKHVQSQSHADEWPSG